MKFRKRLWMLLTAALLLMGSVLTNTVISMSEEYYEDYEEDEEVYIPETYYDPIQTNDIPGWPQGQAVQAAAAIVMDLDTDTVLYGKNVTDQHYPASITKIMTTMIALERGDLDDVITCGEEVYAIEEDSSNLGIQPGEKLTLRQALYGLMLESANDLGNAIAVYIAGSVDAFADLMNQKAEELGCVNTHFANPHGLHNENHYTCAIDMAKIAQAAYSSKTFRKICSTLEYTIPETNIVEEKRGFMNHQRLLQPESDYYQSWCTGGKTGFTSDAWNTLVTYGEKDDMRLVCVLLRENGAGTAYEETTALMNYGFENFAKESVTGDIQTRTFYDILGLKLPNRGTTLEALPALEESAVAVSSPGEVTVPAGTGADELTVETTDSAKGNLRFLYHDVPVGYGWLSFNPLPVIGPLRYEQSRDMEALLQLGAHVSKVRELQSTARNAANAITGFTGRVYAGAKEYVLHNRMTVLLAGGFILLILLIVTVIVFLRVTRESRIQRKRQSEEALRRRRAEEIDAKSAQEIEAELRAVMEAERRRQEAEDRRRAELEEEERKLRETEALLEEIRGEHVEDAEA